GIYQVVRGTIPGVPHVFSFDYQLGGGTDPFSGQERRIGYDLTGGTNPNSPSIVWVVVEDATGGKDWQRFQTTIVPTGDRVTIWVRAGIYWPVSTVYVDLDNVVLKPVGFNVRGKVTLSDFSGAVSSVPVLAQLRAAGTTDPIRTLVLTLDDAGNYVIPDVQPGRYDIAFKASHWLRAVARNVQVVNADVSGVDVILPNGDVDGDNEVSLLDFGALVAAFGTTPGETGWNADADLDGDGEVNLVDFGVLVRNFGQAGEN
ncbi:MAG: dockerin type I domain-containing protein, partial [bacterium]|nr:dockerin type I domain-containing protein [bacterium]